MTQAREITDLSHLSPEELEERISRLEAQKNTGGSRWGA